VGVEVAVPPVGVVLVDTGVAFQENHLVDPQVQKHPLHYLRVITQLLLEMVALVILDIKKNLQLMMEMILSFIL
jgi:hypothetical protein